MPRLAGWAGLLLLAVANSGLAHAALLQVTHPPAGTTPSKPAIVTTATTEKTAETTSKVTPSGLPATPTTPPSAKAPDGLQSSVVDKHSAPIITQPAIKPPAVVLATPSQGVATVAIADTRTGIASVRGMILTYNKALGWDVAHLLAESIVQISQAHALDYRLLAGVIAVESSFRPDAVSSSGAIGLGQLKPSTAQWLGISNPFDPLENMVGVSRYLRFLINRYNGDLDSALSAYFQGQGTIDRNGITQACVPYLTKINDVIHRF
jgi:soluble lytic murein transglycosylase-like protein